MINYILRFLSIVFIIFSTNYSHGQGCSDAGVCTINSVKSTLEDPIRHTNQFTLGTTYGQGDFSILYYNPYLEYSRSFTKKFNLSVRITYLKIDGELSKESGFSDLFLSGNYKILSSVDFIGGIKIPFNDANRKSNGLPLPMHYQTSLGTFDVISGFAYSKKQFTLVSAIQVPLINNNNQFLSELYPLSSLESKYPSTNNFKRQPDLIVRASYTFSLLNNKLQIIPSILPIFHLGEDKFTTNTGEETIIKGSEGLTLNGVMFIRYSLNSRNLVELSYGRPFVTRDVRPDGLTRHYVAGVEFRTKL